MAMIGDDSAVRTSIVARCAGSVIKGRSSRLSTGDRLSLAESRSIFPARDIDGYIPGPFRIDPPKVFQADVIARSISPIVTQRSRNSRVTAARSA